MMVRAAHRRRRAWRTRRDSTRSSWNHALPDASTFQNIIMWAAGTKGPVAVPGTYTVRMHVERRNAKRRRSRSSRIRARRQRRPTLTEQFAFLVKVATRRARPTMRCKLIRNMRSQIADRDEENAGRQARGIRVERRAH